LEHEGREGAGAAMEAGVESFEQLMHHLQG
jgi:hypothetical protein